MAGAAKNAAALAAAAAEPHGLNAAGIAAAQVWRECIDYAIARGAELETFSGLAGRRRPDRDACWRRPAATAVPASCSAAGRRPRRSRLIGQASEGLDAVPLLATRSRPRAARRGAEGLAA